MAFRVIIVSSQKTPSIDARNPGALRFISQYSGKAADWAM
jgi:hypothetical protein